MPFGEMTDAVCYYYKYYSGSTYTFCSYYYNLYPDATPSSVLFIGGIIGFIIFICTIIIVCVVIRKESSEVDGTATRLCKSDISIVAVTHQHKSPHFPNQLAPKT